MLVRAGLVSAVGALVVGHAAWAQSASFTLLPLLPGETVVSDERGIDISGAGDVVIAAVQSSGQSRAVMWRKSAGTWQRVDLPMHACMNLTHLSLARSGDIAVGASCIGSGPAVRWNDLRTSSIQLATYATPTYPAGARAVSDGGAIIVGAAGSGGFINRNSIGSTLRRPTDRQFTLGEDVTADGSVVLGQAWNNLPYIETSYLWNGDNTVRSTFSPEHVPLALATDGSRIVGYVASDRHRVNGYAAVWSPTLVMTPLAMPVAFSATWATDTTPTGDVIVGAGVATTGTRAVVWLGGAARDLANELAARGVELAGLTLLPDVRVSDTGAIVGIAQQGPGSNVLYIAQLDALPACDSIDFNNNAVFPEDQDIIDFFTVLAGGDCSTNNCNDIDFNNNTVFPEDQDVIDFFNVLAGGAC